MLPSLNLAIKNSGRLYVRESSLCGPTYNRRTVNKNSAFTCIFTKVERISMYFHFIKRESCSRTIDCDSLMTFAFADKRMWSFSTVIEKMFTSCQQSSARVVTITKVMHNFAPKWSSHDKLQVSVSELLSFPSCRLLSQTCYHFQN